MRSVKLPKHPKSDNVRTMLWNDVRDGKTLTRYSGSRDEFSCIYFLESSEQLVYIGQTRVSPWAAYHRNKTRWKDRSFDMMYYIPVQSLLYLHQYEARLIKLFQPEWNDQKR